MHKHTLFVAVLLALGACQPAPSDNAGDDPAAQNNVHADIKPDDAAEWTMACANGQSLVVTFDHERQMVTARRSDGLAFDLMRKSVSSGYLYSASQAELKGRGKEASWRAPPVSDTTCQVTQIKPRHQPGL